MTSLRHRDHPDLAASEDPAIALRQLAAARLDGDGDADRHRITDAIRDHHDIALRHCRPGHLTGSALVVDHRAERVLLMLHAKLGRWFQPGGHADGDTNLAAVALREAEEETGIEGLGIHLPAIDVDIHEVRPPKEDPHLHLDVRFLVIAPPDAEELANEESLALRWVTEEELDELSPEVDDSTRRLVDHGLCVARHRLASP